MAQRDSKILLLKNLNAVQKQAVEQIDGPNLILAGAGSGKTRVLTHKIAYLIERKKVKPENILAMTFTNKAANEMKERISQLLKGTIKGLWLGTFHSICARILRKNCEKLGYTGNFVIYDDSDQLSLLKTIIKELEIPKDEQLKPRWVRSKIKNIKNSNKTIDDYLEGSYSFADEYLEDIYYKYITRLQQNNAMDFEDLLLKSNELFKLFPSVVKFYQNIFQYILVDEYQDTNRLQYELIKAMGGKRQNISVVGDDDQSIYRWRGAEIRNILDFKKDFPTCKIFKLEQNYRSNENILKIAHSIISHNINRMEKELWTKKESGERATLKIAYDNFDEANFIVQKIIEETHNNQRNFSDFAILYRINAQSRSFEEALKNHTINYVVIGGIRFYERKEIKDILAYLKILVNQKDSVSLKRIINYPTRGIGEATVTKIDKFSQQQKITFFQALGKIDKIDSIPKRKQETIFQFYKLIQKYIGLKGTVAVSELITALIENLGIFSSLKEEGSIESLNKIENIRELILGINEFIKRNPDLSLEHYLENVALITDVDNWDKSANAVSLLTLHSAKGLEFPVVFITGMEEGLFPLGRNMETDEELEEERRLFYVGATRAKEKLYLSAKKYRRMNGETSTCTISRFLTEIDKDLIEVQDLTYNQGKTQGRQISKPKRIYKFEFEDNSSPTEKLRPGILVRHERFGIGVVRKIEGREENIKANIIFEDVGEKNIVLKYCNLEIIK